MFFYNMLLYNDFKQIDSFNVYGKDTKKYHIATVALLPIPKRVVPSK